MITDARHMVFKQMKLSVHIHIVRDLVVLGMLPSYRCKHSWREG